MKLWLRLSRSILVKKDESGVCRYKLFFEVYWVLSSFYDKKKKELVEVLENLLEMSFIKWEERRLLIKAVDVFKISGLDLEDSYNIVFSREKKVDEMASFDKKLVKKFELAKTGVC